MIGASYHIELSAIYACKLFFKAKNYITLNEVLILSFVVFEHIDNEYLFFQVWILRKRATHTIPKPGLRFYICSLSMATIVYKGQLTSDQLWTYFTDLKVSCY